MIIMSWWFDDWWRKKKKKFEEIDDFDSFFEEVFKEIEEIFKGFGFGTPVIRGFSITIGPDGKPVFKEIGPSTIQPVKEEEKEKEVTVDIVETNNEYLITADLPGLREEDINVEFRDNKLVIKGYGKYTYYKVIDLPSDASKEILEKKYLNGVLTLKIKKKRFLGKIL